MRLAQLDGRHRGETLYVVGTGPSMRAFPLDFLADKTTIGLNQAWRYGALTYGLTAHPELYLEWRRTPARPRLQWIVKRKAPMKELAFDDPRLYVFTTREDYGLLTRREPDTLLLSRGIQCTALHLAARMGAAAVVLVGCDMTDLDGEHHGHDQHVRWLGVAPERVYAEYRACAAEVRRRLREHCGLRVLTLTPFLGVGHAHEDWRRLRDELALPPLPPPPDVSPYRRPDLPAEDGRGHH